MSETAWTAVGASAGLASGAVMRAIVRGDDLAVWRDRDGAVHAWRNRCPHRGMRLSFGYVDGDGRLACRYHGWRFAGGGKCAAIPAHPCMRPPDDISVASFASTEGDGLIWVAPEEAPPPETLAAPGEELTFCRSLVVRADADTVARSAPGEEASCGIIRTECKGGSVVLALQPIDSARCGVHVLTQVLDADRARRRLDVAAWSRELRGQIEAQVSGNA